MYLKCHPRLKDGKEHRYYSLCEKVACAGGRRVERHVFYLGEINDSQREGWLKLIEAFDAQSEQQTKMALFASDRPVPTHAAQFAVQVRLGDFRLERPRQWGACWVFVRLWEQLKLEEFWRQRLPSSREGTSWYHVLMVLCAYRLIDPGSEWRLHREWYDKSAMGDLLDEDFALAAKDNLYRCLDKLVQHKTELFNFLQERWKDLFGVTYDVLLYDLTSTYFESDPPFAEGDKRQFGYSRDKRPDCVQVVIALVVTPEGFPLAYEVLSGNTSDRTTLKAFLEKIQSQYGKARRIWVMDRGIPTEENLEQMRQASDPPIQYVVGTPKGQLSKLEAALLELPWQQARLTVQVKLLAKDQELFVLVNSQARVSKERAIRRRKLKNLWARLKELKEQRPSYQTLLMKLGAAKAQAGRVWSLVELKLPEAPRSKKARQRVAGFEFALSRNKLRQVFKREGRYILRTNAQERDAAKVWEFYLQLVQVEEAFKNLKGDLSIRPIFHQLENRIEAHVFVCFLSYCLHVTLGHQLRARAPGLTVRQVLEKFGRMQMMNVYFPTTDGRELLFVRYTQPEKDQKLLLAQMNWQLPPQPPPKITAKGELEIGSRPLGNQA